jgi:hypothetical protein
MGSRIFITGLPASVDTERLRDRLSELGPVISVSIIREGDEQQPWVVAEMDLGPVEATAVARRIDGIYYAGRFIKAHVMSRG